MEEGGVQKKKNTDHQAAIGQRHIREHAEVIAVIIGRGKIETNAVVQNNGRCDHSVNPRAAEDLHFPLFENHDQQRRTAGNNAAAVGDNVDQKFCGMLQ